MTTLASAASVRIGGSDRTLSEPEVTAFVVEALSSADLDGCSVCVLVPDATRSCPLPLLLGAVHQALHGRVAYFAICELIANASKHAPGATLSVHGTLTAEHLVLEVADNGAGGADSSGSGLRGIARRLGELGGGMTISSPAGRGTTATIRIPHCWGPSETSAARHRANQTPTPPSGLSISLPGL